MSIDKIYTGTTKSVLPERRLGKKDLPWLVGAWFISIIWACVISSPTPIINISVLSFFIFIAPTLRLYIAPILRLFVSDNIYIIIRNERLSIHTEDAILWSTLLKDIVSIKLEGGEDKRFFSFAPEKAMVIRNNKNDSYFIPLSIEFDNLSADELVKKLNEAVKQNV